MINSASIAEASKGGPSTRVDGILPLMAPAASALCALLVYLLTLAPDLTWAHFGSDGGELITASMTWGIPHPPGYPTYTLLSRVSSLLPVGTMAWRFHVFSAVAAATAVFFVALTAQTLLRNAGQRSTVPALAAGLSVAFAPLFWSQALIAEVYTLNAAIVAIWLWTLLSKRPVMLSGAFLSLALTTHLSSLLLLPMALALTRRTQWSRMFLGLFLGLLPLLALPILARGDSPVIWGEAATLSGWWWLISGRLYQANLGPPGLAHLSAVSATLLRQLAWAGWLLVALGAAMRWIPPRITYWLLATSALYVFYTFLYRPNDAVVHLLPLLMLLAPLLAAGLARFGAAGLLFPLLILGLNLQAVDISDDTAVRRAATHVLAAAPENAVLLTPGDAAIFALWYFQHVEGQRPDLTLVDTNLMAFDWYRARLALLEPGLLGLAKDNPADFRRQNGRWRPVCDVAPELGGLLACSMP